MAKHKEADFIIPVLRVIYDNGGECLMSTIKDEVANYITLTPEDLEPMPSRSKTEPCYRQIVGNLISHRTKGLFKYLDVVPANDNSSKYYTLKLNEEGKAEAEKYIQRDYTITIDYPDFDKMFDIGNISIVSDSSSFNVDYLDNRVLQAAEKKKFNRSYITNNSLAQSINLINNYVCQYGKLVGEDHKSFIDKNGKMYTEAHHLIPMSASKDFFPRNLDRPSNIVTLCPNCHNALHHGSEKEIKTILKTLYDHYIPGLNREEIYISFNDLYNKYYKLKENPNGR